jgi:hypothetical protein
LSFYGLRAKYSTIGTIIIEGSAGRVGAPWLSASTATLAAFRPCRPTAIQAANDNHREPFNMAPRFERFASGAV